ncbi:MAG TPA: ParB/RepB/Spo0J family partition protein [Candidatus Woesebacteria bacterium]|nr:ParB/RepB/Spo0J family partition protein [Candidatus Woesebacteria bacterium]
MSDSSVQTLKTSVLQPNPFQPRGKIQKEELDELCQSIKIYGIIEPLVVASTPAGYQIIAGERRWRAAQILELDTVPVIIKKTTPKGMLEMALIENVQRINLNPIERAKAFQQLVNEFRFSIEEIATRIGKSIYYIHNSIRLLALPDAIKDGVITGQITEGHARALAGAPDKKVAIELYKKILKENASVRRAEELVRAYNQTHSEHAVNKGKSFVFDQEALGVWQRSVEKIFHAKPKVKLTQSQRQTRLTITLMGDIETTKGDLDHLLSLFERPT